MNTHNLITSLLCAALISPLLLAQHTPENLLYRRTDGLPGADFTGALLDRDDQIKLCRQAKGSTRLSLDCP